MNIPIFLASDDNYASFLCTTLYSILKNTKSDIDINVLDGGISDKSKKKIKKSLKEFKNYKITYHDMTKFDLKRFPDLVHLSVNAYSRFFIPELVENENKVLYLDVDIIVKGDVRVLYDIDLDSCPLAAALHSDVLSGENFKNFVYPEFKNPHLYFNSGVILFNIEEFKKNNYAEKLVETCFKYKDKIRFADQDIFNILFENNFKIINAIYNFFPARFDDYVKHLGELEADKLLDEAIILHYVGSGTKPWQNKKIKTSEFFWEVANKTCFRDKIESIYNKYNKINNNDSFFGIFSIAKTTNHKIITILGIKIKIKRKLKH